MTPETYNLGPYAPGSTDCIAGIGIFDFGMFIVCYRNLKLIRVDRVCDRRGRLLAKRIFYFRFWE